MATVLVIDDQTASRQQLAELAHGFDTLIQVEAFASPHDALRWLGWHPADLVLVDCGLAGIDGIDFIRRLRALPGCTHLPVVIVTAQEQREARYAALDAGATDSLIRPVDALECRVRCRNLLTQYEQHRIIRDRARWLERQVNEAVGAIRVREQETLLRLAKCGEYRDEITGNHVIRMAKYARLIAEGLDLTRDECDVIELAAPMHDIGKIGIRDHILLKPGRLTAEEFEEMKTHAAIGGDALARAMQRAVALHPQEGDLPEPVRFLQVACTIAYYHHERWDGTGYPRGLAGEAIPRPARLMALADVYDALTTARVYKAAWSREATARHIAEQAGSHFDPAVVAAFVAIRDEFEAIANRLAD